MAIPTASRPEPKAAPYDVLVVGGGPAGMTAALEAARAGARVLLVEKNRRLGEKLRITGGGRCNISNNTLPVRELLSAYKEAGKFLFSPFAQHDVTATKAWFGALGIDMVEEPERRLFPVSQSAVAVAECLVAAVQAAGVSVVYGAAVSTLSRHAQGFVVTTAGGETYTASRLVLATGGTSRPETGSTGDALPWLVSLGHTVAAPDSTLVPVGVREQERAARLSGVSLAACGVSVVVDGIKGDKRVGKVLFTHVGLSGPAVLNSSRAVATALATGASVQVVLDLMPETASEVLEALLLERLIAQPNKLVRNQFTQLLPGALVVPVLEAAGVPLETPSRSLTAAARRQLVATVKALAFTASHVLGLEKAIVSSGGVVLTEVDFKTMESRLVPGLYLIGDLLNIDRPSGGYSLQLCWTTGVVAGRSAGGGILK